MEYKGTKTEQAEILLRTVKMGGNIEDKKPEIDKQFLTLMVGNVDITKTALKNYLTENNIKENEVGGKIDKPVSFITLKGNRVYAKYFVIHDVSTPSIPNELPNNINDSSFMYKKTYWNNPNISAWSSVDCHSLLTRTGQVRMLHDFSDGWRATKFESNKFGLGEVSRGLFLHIELGQPRYFKPPTSNEENAPYAPKPGFTDKQYERLALLYICASFRKGEWLIPAFHGCIDEGIKGGHDDPQNFELNKFTTAILNLVKNIKV